MNAAWRSPPSLRAGTIAGGNDGTTGLMVGGVAGGVLGSIIAPGGSDLLGTLLGPARGAVAGRLIDHGGRAVQVRASATRSFLVAAIAFAALSPAGGTTTAAAPPAVDSQLTNGASALKSATNDEAGQRYCRATK